MSPMQCPADAEQGGRLSIVGMPMQCPQFHARACGFQMCGNDGMRLSSLFPNHSMLLADFSIRLQEDSYRNETMQTGLKDRQLQLGPNSTDLPAKIARPSEGLQTIKHTSEEAAHILSVSSKLIYTCCHEKNCYRQGNLEE